MPRQDRVTRLINILGALTRLREAEFATATNQGYLEEREIEALKQHYLDLRVRLTMSDRERITDASFEALVAAKQIVREWRERDDETYGHTTATVPPDFLEPKTEAP